LHNPILVQAQVGATIRKLVDYKVSKKAEPLGLPSAIMATYLAVIEDAPAARVMLQVTKSLFDPRLQSRFLGELMRSTVPGAVEWTARHFDTDANGNPIQRQPKTILDYWKQSIPGLRQQVPEREVKIVGGSPLG